MDKFIPLSNLAAFCELGDRRETLALFARKDRFVWLLRPIAPQSDGAFVSSLSKLMDCSTVVVGVCFFLSLLLFPLTALVRIGCAEMVTRRTYAILC